MAAQIPCPHCRAPAEIAQEDLGRPHRCRNCGREFSPGSTADVAPVPPAPGPDPDWSPSRPTVLAAGSTFAHGRYQIRRKLGGGGQGAVYLAYDTHLGRDVALKLPRFDPDAGAAALDRFDREARTAAGLDHPNICPVHDVGRVDGVPYLTMKYIEGEPLSPRVGDQLLPPRRAAEIVRELALVLAEAHAQGVVHRDLKPSNVMVHPRRGLVIMDFGLARRTSSDDPRLTKTGAVLGTPAYMSPEQALGETQSAGPASDIYSLGVILYELLTGRLPFEFEGPPLAILYRIVHVDPPPPATLRSGLDARLEAICLKAMAKRVDDRYASMTELAEALHDILAPMPPPETPMPKASKSPAPLSPVPSTVPVPPAAGVTNSIGMTLVLISPGEFLMGSPDSDKEAYDDEKPQHRVAITRPFYLGAYPITQEEYQRVTGQNPSRFKGSGRLPVEMVSWYDAVAFCNRLSEADGLTPYYNVTGKEVTILGGEGYRLPTEAEWEYACRAGTTTRYGFSDDAVKLGDYAWYSGNAGGQTHPVGQKTPNGWCLYDMHGNVWEWCWDGWDAGYYRQSPSADPSGPPASAHRVVRGGSWVSVPRYVRAANRIHFEPSYRNGTLGFRCARVQAGK